MPPDDLTHGGVTADLLAEGARVFAVCNACRYCEQYCPVFPAMEERRTFASIDLAYLANLCHNCGECLYACQYAPPHEFGINVPETLARLRLRSYEHYCWPSSFARAFRANGVVAGIGLAVSLMAILTAATFMASDGVPRPSTPGDFYAVIPHHIMVAIFATVFAFAVLALSVAVSRFARDIRDRAHGTASSASGSSRARALRDILTLRHLHATGVDCVTAEEFRTPFRRWCHHATFYGFMLCFASTTVAAVYHGMFGWRAPYSYTSLPVVLGVLGGIGLTVGPAGLWWLRRRRDPALTDSNQDALDEGFLALLLITSISGLALLLLRSRTLMPAVLIAHLGAVLALFLLLPYGKFVHGLYRAVALVVFAKEQQS